MQKCVYLHMCFSSEQKGVGVGAEWLLQINTSFIRLALVNDRKHSNTEVSSVSPRVRSEARLTLQPSAFRIPVLWQIYIINSVPTQHNSLGTNPLKTVSYPMLLSNPALLS